MRSDDDLTKKTVESPGNQTQRSRLLDHRGLARRSVEDRVATVVLAIPAGSIVRPELAHELVAERDGLPGRTQKVKQRTQLGNWRRINDILALESIRPPRGAKKRTQTPWFLDTRTRSATRSEYRIRVRDEQLMSRSQPGLCTPVDIRSKKAQKVSLFLTFRPARRDPDVSGLDRQVVSCQADRT